MCINQVDFIFRYHTDSEIKNNMAEIERKFHTVASFDANENEFFINYPQLRVTDDVSVNTRDSSSKII